jgi:hypothetical protein
LLPQQVESIASHCLSPSPEFKVISGATSVSRCLRLSPSTRRALARDRDSDRTRSRDFLPFAFMIATASAPLSTRPLQKHVAHQTAQPISLLIRKQLPKSSRVPAISPHAHFETLILPIACDPNHNSDLQAFP